MVGDGGIVEGGNRDKGGGVVEVAHDTNSEAVGGFGLFEVEGEPQGTYVTNIDRHGIDAAFVEYEAVVATVCVGGAIVDHGFILVGHADILIGEGPTGGLYACFGSGGGGVGVEVVGVGKVCRTDLAGRIVCEVGLERAVGGDGEGIGGVGGNNSAAACPVGECVVGVGYGTQSAGTATGVGASTGHSAASRGVGGSCDGIHGWIGECDVIDIVAAEVPRVACSKDVTESNIVSAASVGGKADCVEHGGGRTAVIDGCYRHEGACVV